MEQRISLITLGVADIGRARAFYEALGWVGGVARRRGGVLPGRRHGRGPLEPGEAGRRQRVTDSGGWGGVTLAHNVRSPAEVDAVLAEAEAAGATIGRPGAPTEWGGYSGAFVDPDGHPWEVAHNPGWTIDDGGSIHLH